VCNWLVGCNVAPTVGVEDGLLVHDGLYDWLVGCNVGWRRR
jgi:hypothetical protein